MNLNDMIQEQAIIWALTFAGLCLIIMILHVLDD